MLVDLIGKNPLTLDGTTLFVLMLSKTTQFGIGQPLFKTKIINHLQYIFSLFTFGRCVVR